jgi:galactose mutarotase-like enzyme
MAYYANSWSDRVGGLLLQKYRKQRNYGCRIHDQYTYFGMRTLVLENDKLRFSLLLDKGGEVFECVYKPLGIDLIWLSENGVQNPTDYLSTSADPTATFIDYYPGGWQEVLPNGGPTASYLGAQYGQHGEVTHMPWDYEIVTDTPEEIQVTLMVKTKKIPFFLKKTYSLKADSAELEVVEQLENLGATELKYMWGHHLVFGKPFAIPGCKIDLPDGVTVLTESKDSEVAAPGRISRGGNYAWPLAETENGQLDLSVLPKKDDTSDIVYLTDFGPIGWYTLENAELQMGVKIEWDAEQFPYLWYWQEFGGTKTYPWYGRHYNVGLEPFSSYPTHGLEEAIRNGSAAEIAAGETKRFWMKLKPYEIKEAE